MMVVQTRMSASWRMKASMTASSSPSPIWPWPARMRAVGLSCIAEDEAAVGECGGLGEEAMGADEDVDLALTGALHDVFLLAIGFESAYGLDHERIVGHALAERAIVLLGEDGGGDENG